MSIMKHIKAVKSRHITLRHITLSVPLPVRRANEPPNAARPLWPVAASSCWIELGSLANEANALVDAQVAHQAAAMEAGNASGAIRHFHCDSPAPTTSSVAQATSNTTEAAADSNREWFQEPTDAKPWWSEFGMLPEGPAAKQAGQPWNIPEATVINVGDNELISDSLVTEKSLAMAKAAENILELQVPQLAQSEKTPKIEPGNAAQGRAAEGYWFGIL